MTYELSQRIKHEMNAAGFTEAAETFHERVRFYSERELARIERFWLG